MADDMTTAQRQSEANYKNMIANAVATSAVGRDGWLPFSARYGAADAVMEALAPILEERDREVARKAWDEGQESGWTSAQGEWQVNGGVCDMHRSSEPEMNPYNETGA